MLVVIKNFLKKCDWQSLWPARIKLGWRH